MTKLWGGRFEGDLDPFMAIFNASIHFDTRLWKADIQGSAAYADALHSVGILSAEEKEQIVQGLEQIAAEWETGAFQVQPEDEDIHTAVERRLGELIGPAAGKLHTGRSRNDQVATDLRLFLLETCDEMEAQLRALQLALVQRAEQHIDLIMPGYTHLQPAQPVRFSHWLMSYFWMLQRDCERMQDMQMRISVLPLGSGALAGTPLPIDRSALAQRLGLQMVSKNSLDAVSDRDFVAEFLFWAAMVGIHISRLSEDIILFSNPNIGFLSLSDAFSTGSSLMPQKKNPDSFELARGKSGRLLGNLTGLLTMLKGLPSTYNKDLQEDKEPLFDSIDTLNAMLPVVTGAIHTLTAYGDKMRAALDDFMLATDLADWLVERGIPFRESHSISGQVVRAAEQRGCSLRDLSVAELKAIHPAFGKSTPVIWDFEHSVEQRAAPGGTAKASVQDQIAQARALLGATSHQ
jgi:argininosuccinate lyase